MSRKHQDDPETRILLERLQYQDSHSYLSDVSVYSEDRGILSAFLTERSKIKRRNISDLSGKADIQQEEPLDNYPQYPWSLELDINDLPQFEDYKTISRHLFAKTAEIANVCPYGDEPAPIARIEKIQKSGVVRDAYTLSALRFKLNPFQDAISQPTNKLLGIPEPLQPIYKQLSARKIQAHVFQLGKLTSLQMVQEAVDQLQQQMRCRYINELVPFMNANPFNPRLHDRELSPEMMHDLSQYVQLQNSPYAFFDLMQWLERDVAIRHWHSLRTEQHSSVEDSIILVMTSWRHKGHRRKGPIKCPIGVPLSYMQSMRRKDQPCINQEFAGHAHGALNHWLQEHVWQRFCDRYPEKCSLPPSTFFKQIGHLHVAFADAIYELHMNNMVNPANTNFWSILQFYLPLMSPWP